MTALLERAFGYRGDTMHLPVANVEAAIPFYETVLGFRVEARQYAPVKSAVLSRDQVHIGLEENGGDPTQDGCAFHVRDLPALVAEFAANGLQQSGASIGTEHRDGVAWRVYFVVAPDGLCYWFGERAAT